MGVHGRPLEQSGGHLLDRRIAVRVRVARRPPETLPIETGLLEDLPGNGQELGIAPRVLGEVADDVGEVAEAGQLARLVHHRQTRRCLQPPAVVAGREQVEKDRTGSHRRSLTVVVPLVPVPQTAFLDVPAQAPAQAEEGFGAEIAVSQMTVQGGEDEGLEVVLAGEVGTGRGQADLFFPSLETLEDVVAPGGPHVCRLVEELPVDEVVQRPHGRVGGQEEGVAMGVGQLPCSLVQMVGTAGRQFPAAGEGFACLHVYHLRDLLPSGRLSPAEVAVGST